MKKHHLWLLIPLMTILTLSGCLRIDRGITIKPNGKVEASMGAFMNQELMEMLYGSREDFYSASEEESEEMMEGFGEVSSMTAFEGAEPVRTEYSYDGSTWYGYETKQTFGSLTEAAAFFSDDNFTYRFNKTGLLMKTVNIQIISNGSISDISNDSDTYSSMIHDVFYVEVPGKIIETDGIIDQNNPKRVSWSVSDIDYGKTISKSMTVTYINVLPYVLIGAAILLVAIVLVVVLVAVVINKKRKNDSYSGVSIG